MILGSQGGLSGITGFLEAGMLASEPLEDAKMLVLGIMEATMGQEMQAASRS